VIDKLSDMQLGYGAPLNLFLLLKSIQPYINDLLASIAPLVIPFFSTSRKVCLLIPFRPGGVDSHPPAGSLDFEVCSPLTAEHLLENDKQYTKLTTGMTRMRCRSVSRNSMALSTNY
jgi:hypothetical protein